MIKLTYLIRKRPDLSDEAFVERWADAYAALLTDAADTLNARRYVMSKRLESVCNTCVKSMRKLDNTDYDGVIEIWWDSLEDYQSGVGSAPGLAAMDTLIDAERRFVDFAHSTAFFADERLVFDRASTPPEPAVRHHSKAGLSDQTMSSEIIN